MEPTPTTTPTPTPQPENSLRARFSGTFGLILAAVIGIVAVVIGASVLFGFNAANQYQGMIKKIESETEEVAKPLR